MNAAATQVFIVGTSLAIAGVGLMLNARRSTRLGEERLRAFSRWTGLAMLVVGVLGAFLALVNG